MDQPDLGKELERLAQVAPSGQAILNTCLPIVKLLLEKNISYGNSALDPVRIFSKASTVEQLLVRIDDKLSRISRGVEYGVDDTVADLIGYLLLLRVALNEEMAN